MEKLARRVLEKLKQSNAVTLEASEDKSFKRIVELLNEECQREADLEQAVNVMLDDLERSNPGEFQRFKMFPLLKKRLAKERGVIL